MNRHIRRRTCNPESLGNCCCSNVKRRKVEEAEEGYDAD
jgi:hypothetical protein